MRNRKCPRSYSDKNYKSRSRKSVNQNLRLDHFYFCNFNSPIAIIDNLLVLTGSTLLYGHLDILTEPMPLDEGKEWWLDRCFGRKTPFLMSWDLGCKTNGHNFETSVLFMIYSTWKEIRKWSVLKHHFVAVIKNFYFIHICR